MLPPEKPPELLEELPEFIQLPEDRLEPLLSNDDERFPELPAVPVLFQTGLLPELPVVERLFELFLQPRW